MNEVLVKKLRLTPEMKETRANRVAAAVDKPERGLKSPFDK